MTKRSLNGFPRLICVSKSIDGNIQYNNSVPFLSRNQMQRQNYNSNKLKISTFSLVLTTTNLNDISKK